MKKYQTIIFYTVKSHFFWLQYFFHLQNIVNKEILQYSQNPLTLFQFTDYTEIIGLQFVKYQHS